MVTTHILYLTKTKFIDIVVRSNFPLISAGSYLLRVLSGNIYLPRGSNVINLCINSSRILSFATWVIPLLNILFLHELSGHILKK